MLDILKRYLTCTKCKKVWNVSTKSPYVKSSYVCPKCEERRLKVKNVKKLTLKQKKFLISKGLDPNIHGIVKNHPDFFEFYNKVTGVTFKLWR